MLLVNLDLPPLLHCLYPKTDFSIMELSQFSERKKMQQMISFDKFMNQVTVYITEANHRFLYYLQEQGI